jgi:hypothetical protein
MRRNGSLFIAIIFCLILATSCKYNVKEELDGVATPCDTTNVTYTSTIVGIINTYSCLSCHSGGTPIGGFSLEDYSHVKAKVDDGRLFGAINHSPGFTPMPNGLPKMNQCDIDKVKAWIDAGAPNN